MEQESTELADRDVALAREIRAQTDSKQGAADIPYRDTVDSALSVYEANKARLYRQQDGKPIYAPDEHNARESTLLADLDSRLQGAVQSAESRAADAELAARRVQRDPLFGLDDGDTQKASGLAPFVREEAEAQPLDRLTETVRTALLTGTKVEKLLTLRYAARRVEAERAPYAQDGPKARQQHPQAGHVRTLAIALDELEAHLAPPDAKERVQTAKERRAEANRLRAYAGRAREEADGSAARGIAQMRQRLGML